MKIDSGDIMLCVLFVSFFGSMAVAQIFGPKVRRPDLEQRIADHEERIQALEAK